MTTTLFSELSQRLDWPKEADIFHPPGPGPAIYSRLAQSKIETPLGRMLGSGQVEVGILAPDPSAVSSDAPIALVCRFARALTPQELNATRKLAWNFCRCPLLVTVEPHLVRAWSCYERPDAATGQFRTDPLADSGEGSLTDLDRLADTLHWIYLASGQFIARNAARFDRRQRADVTLLENLRYVRKRLTKDLPIHIAHDLLARVIFVQFLFQRADANGYTALSPRKLEQLYEGNVLSQRHAGLSSVLMHRSDTFSLFKWLNERFNGDLFPTDYAEEQHHVREHHLEFLAGFVSGTLKMRTGQYLLWPHYSFDTIPLEFISSIYEEFVTNRADKVGIGEHYTPPFLVDFMLDKVLSWFGTDYNLRILDPCCGSGVFLVRAFQRLVHRWRNANPKVEPQASLLRQLLEKNLFGVDIREDAVRVSSFSLYLAMCDEIDPKYYWTQVHFPSLREVRLRTADFFVETMPEVSTQHDSGKKETSGLYDIIIGNAPWGKKSLTEAAGQWAKMNGWPAVGNQSGTLFLAKALKLCRPSGGICMIQPAGALLFNVSDPSLKFRKRLFSNHKVREIVNLSALRFLNIFPRAVGPACIVTLHPKQPDDQPIAYWSPKQTETQEEKHRVIIDDQDLNWVWPDEAANEPVVWPSLMWGGRRDLEFIQRVANRYPTLRDRIRRDRKWRSKRGFQRGTKEAKEHTSLLNIPILEKPSSEEKACEASYVWKSLPWVAPVSRFPRNTDPMFAYPKPLETYRLPLLILENSWVVSDPRFDARLIVRDNDLSDDRMNYLLYSQSFFGIRHPDITLMAAATVVANSAFAVYFFYLTSGRLASYRPTIRKKDFEMLPLPSDAGFGIEEVACMDRTQIDSTALSLFGATEVDHILVDNFISTTLRDFKDSFESPGMKALTDNAASKCLDLEDYCATFMKVLASGFGELTSLCATIYTTHMCSDVPYRIVAIHLGATSGSPICYRTLSRPDLLKEFAKLQERYQSQADHITEMYHRKVARIYQDAPLTDGDGRSRNVPSVFLVKPNRVRYWTRSAALHDADSVASDLMQWAEADRLREDSTRHD
ncbi:MAG: N-6 DNA methylase [Phycisphaerales bacterium]